MDIGDECYYVDRYHKKFYQIVEAKQYGIGLIDIKVKECELKFLRIEVSPKDNFINKETIEENVYEMVPFGRKKKCPYQVLKTYELQDKFIVQKI